MKFVALALVTAIARPVTGALVFRDASTSEAKAVDEHVRRLTHQAANLESAGTSRDLTGRKLRLPKSSKAPTGSANGAASGAMPTPLFHYGEGIYIAPLSCPRDCLDGSNPMTIIACDPLDVSQRFDFVPIGDGSPAFQAVNAETGTCIGISDCSDKDVAAVMLPCTDPKTALVPGPSNQITNYYCWTMGTYKFFDSSEYEVCTEPWWGDDDPIYFNGIYFLDQSAVEALPPLE